MDVCQQSDVYACNKLYVTHFIVMFTLLWRSGTEPALQCLPGVPIAEGQGKVNQRPPLGLSKLEQ